MKARAFQGNTMLSTFSRLDPRAYQIAMLSALLAFGIVGLDFQVAPLNVLAILGAAQVTQALAERLRGGRGYDPKSALISSLSLCILLRTDSALLAAATSSFAVASKFLFRIRGKHIFNPTNIALVAAMALSGLLRQDTMGTWGWSGADAWVSPGQWGNAAVFAFFMACLGGIVVNRAARADITFAFLFFYAGLVVGRSVWLGDPMTIPLHRLSSGALVLFAFFMISDPKTTPDSRPGRVVFAGLVAFAAYWVTFKWFRQNGLLFSLAALSPLVPLIDRVFKGARYDWAFRTKESSHEAFSLSAPNARVS